MVEKNINQLIRISNTDIDGNKQVGIGLTKIKGVSAMFANAACAVTGIEETEKIGKLSQESIKKLEDFFNNPLKYDIPTWLLNRRKDPESGADMHLMKSDIKFVQGNDIKVMRILKSYKGVRHAKGLTVRGQRTRSNFRSNKGKGASRK